MSQKTAIRRKNRQSCVGDMNERITLKDRAIQVPEFQSTDFKEKFSGTRDVWANVNTSNGHVLFTGVNVDVALTHTIIIRFLDGVTTQTWVEFEGNNLKIVEVEDLDERHEFLRLRCTLRGDKDLESAQA